MASDISEIERQIQSRYPEVKITRVKVSHPVDDDGLWFFEANGIEIQMESSTGKCPFLVESDAHDRRRWVHSVDEAVCAVKEELGLT